MSRPDTLSISLGGGLSCPVVGGKNLMISMGQFCPDAEPPRPCPPPLVEAAALADEINAAHSRAAHCLTIGLNHGVRAGELLLRAKIRVGHGGWLRWMRENISFSARTAQLYMQLARLVPDAQRVAHLPLRRTVLELQRLDRDAQRQAIRAKQEEGRRRTEHGMTIMGTALGAVHAQLDRLNAAPDLTEIVLEIVRAQLDHLGRDRELASELIEALLFDAREAGVPIASLIDAFDRRFGPTKSR